VDPENKNKRTFIIKENTEEVFSHIKEILYKYGLTKEQLFVDKRNNYEQ